MAFADLAKSHADFIAGHVFGESILYKSYSGSTWSTVAARVQRRPVDIVGSALVNSIDVFLSKTAVAALHVGKDLLRIVADAKPGKTPTSYRVTEVLGEGPGHWWLRCVQ